MSIRNNSNTNTNQSSLGNYAKVQKEVRLYNNKPAQILRPRQKPDWVEMYSSDEDIFAENEPEEKIELITEFTTESLNKEKEISKDLHTIIYNQEVEISRDGKKEKIEEKTNNIENKIIAKELAKPFSEDRQEQEEENKSNNSEDEQYMISANRPNASLAKPKRKIHISVVVDDNAKNKKEINTANASSSQLIKPNDILERKIFDNVDADDEGVFKDLLNTRNLKLKIIEEENKKKQEEENKVKRQFEEHLQYLRDKEKQKEQESMNDPDDDEIFTNTGNDVTIDINKKIIEKYEKKIQEKKLKESLDKTKENQLEDKGLKVYYSSDKDMNMPNLPPDSDSLNKEPEDEVEEEENDDMLYRPIFKEKDTRETIKELVRREEQEIHMQEMEEKLKAQKKLETKKLVIKYIKEDLNQKSVFNEEENCEMPNDTDDPDDLEEYEQWKLRELKRIKKQAEEDEIKLKEKIEIERRRNLTDEQRKEENIRLGSDDTLRPFKSKLKFLQKYYHKGAFFSNERQENMEHVFNRDYNLPTWEDKIDKSNLPAILQKRRGLQFKKGQTKYTHLTAEDTSNFDPLFKVPENIANKVSGAMAGLKAKDKFDIKYSYGKKSKNK